MRSRSMLVLIGLAASLGVVCCGIDDTDDIVEAWMHGPMFGKDWNAFRGT